MDLAKLEMEGNNINDYIAKFENLLHKADIPRTKVGSIQKFKDGLRQRVLHAILNKERWPDTINQWEEATRREVQRFSIIKEAMGDRANNFLSTKQAKWQTTAQQLKSSTKKKDEAVPMEIDAGQVRDKDPKKEAKNAHLRKEGRCYKWGQQGHLKRNCPDWPKRPDKPPPYPSKACSTNTLPLVQETEEEKDPNLKELA
jgi:hypothetical protein